MLWCCLPLLVACCLLAASTSLSLLLAGRVLASAAGWLCYPTATLMVSECVHPTVRGWLGVFPSIFLGTAIPSIITTFVWSFSLLVWLQ